MECGPEIETGSSQLPPIHEKVEQIQVRSPVNASNVGLPCYANYAGQYITRRMHLYTKLILVFLETQPCKKPINKF